MMLTLTLLGIYILAVTAILGMVRLKPNTLRRPYPIIITALFSFVPALPLGREMLSRTKLWQTFTAMPDWVLFGLAGLFVLGIIPVRNWIRKDVLEQSANAARSFLDKLPERVMTIEAAESRGDISLEEATERKTQIQRDADRIAAVDGVGRLLYLLLKIHMARITLQIIATIIVAALLGGSPVSEVAVINVAAVGLDALMVLAPFMVLVGCVPFVRDSIDIGCEAPVGELGQGRSLVG